MNSSLITRLLFVPPRAARLRGFVRDTACLRAAESTRDDEGSEPEVHRPSPHHARRSFSVRSPPSAEELIKAGTQLETA